MFFPPVPLIRKRMIMKKMRMCGAVSPETARTPEEAGFYPGVFPMIINVMIRRGDIAVTQDGRFYLAGM